jgi:nitrite reductase/ring-hydroxylating ferredoxin subunit
MFRDIASVEDLLPGGMRAYTIDDNEIVLCNDGGRFYAFQRRCGHMNAPLDMGTANGYIVTCPLHSVQFDATTGNALSPPVPAYSMWEEAIPPTGDNFSRWVTLLMEHVKTCDIRTYPVKVENGRISVDI